MSWRKKIGWGGPCRDPVSLVTRAGSGAGGPARCGRERVGGPSLLRLRGRAAEGEEGGDSAGSDAAERDGQRTHYRVHAVRETRLVKTFTKRAPKVKCDLPRHNPTPAPTIPSDSVGIGIGGLGARSWGPRRAVRRRALRQPLRLVPGEPEIRFDRA